MRLENGTLIPEIVAGKMDDEEEIETCVECGEPEEDHECLDCGNPQCQCTCGQCPACGDDFASCPCYECGSCGKIGELCECIKCDECDKEIGECECDKCGDCGKDTADCKCEGGIKSFQGESGEEVTVSAAAKLWKLKLTRALSRDAADFYLLYDLFLDGLDDGRFKAFAMELAEEFANYADMTAGGELRNTYHIWRDMKNIEGYAQIVNDFWPPPHYRPMAWAKWKEIREKHGLKALEWARDAFLRKIGGGFGGEPWARITESVRMFRAGEITAVMYVDLCWGTQHNCGQFFNKLWGTSELLGVLDANLNGKLAVLRQYATEEIAKLHLEKRKTNA